MRIKNIGFAMIMIMLQPISLMHALYLKNASSGMPYQFEFVWSSHGKDQADKNIPLDGNHWSTLKKESGLIYPPLEPGQAFNLAQVFKNDRIFDKNGVIFLERLPFKVTAIASDGTQVELEINMDYLKKLHYLPISKLILTPTLQDYRIALSSDDVGIVVENKDRIARMFVEHKSLTK